MRLSRTYLLRATLLSLAPWMLLSSGCETLPMVDVGVCGNGVVEQASEEDCDCVVASASPDQTFDPNKTLDLPECNIRDKPAEKRCALPGEAHACRYICSQDVGCPTGFGCGSDGVCRKTKGVFEVLGSAVDVEAERIEVADFDGDGRDDLLAIGSATVSAAFTEPNGALSSVVSFATNGAQPAIGKLTDDAVKDATDDLVLAIGFGTNVFQGGGGRTFSPTTYDTRELMDEVEDLLDKSKGNVKLVTTLASMQAPAQMDGANVSAFAVALLQDGGGAGQFGTIARVVLGEASDPNFVSVSSGAVPIPAPPELPIPSADLTGDTLPEVVLAPQASPEVVIYSPFAGGKTPPPPIVFALRKDPQNPAKKTFVAGKAFLYDVDNDSDLDVLVTTTCPLDVQKPGPAETGTCFELQVSKNLGANAFEPVASPLIQLTPPAMPGQGPGSFAPYRPAAIGDLDNDGRFDIVDGFGVLMRNQLMPNEFVRVYKNSRAPFVSCAVFDANHDENNDVFCGSDLSPDITFLAGAGTNVFGDAVLSTRGPVSSFTPGDFDGDGVLDLAFAEWDGPIEGIGAHLLSVSFGRAYSYPEQPTRMASFEKVLSISNIDFSLLGIDAANDMQVTFAATDSSGKTGMTIGAIAGASSRQLQCAHVEIGSLSVSNAGTSLHVPNLFFVGQFDAADGSDGAHNDVAFLGTLVPNPTSAFGVLRSSGAAQLKHAWTSTVEGLSLGAEAAQFVDGVVLNLDGGSDEILIAAGNDGPDKNGGLAIVSFINGEPTVGQGSLMTDKGTRFYKHFRVVDMDGDHDDDVIALGYELEPTGMPGMGKGLGLRSWATVMLNDGNGHLCWAPSDMTGCSVIAKQLDAPILDLDWFDVDGDGKKEILAVTESSVRVLRFSAEGTTGTLEEDELPLPLSIQEGWSAIRRCDANGDGVDDLALASAGRIYVFGGVPVLR